MDNNQAEKISYIKNLKPLTVIIVIGILLYLPVLFFNFTYLDDNNLIIGNQYFLSNLSNFFKSFTIDVFHLFNSSAFYYRPVLTISLMLDYQIGGISPFIYHFTNVILHISASYLLFIFLSKLNYKKELSFLFSLIFLVHPVLTQAVAWVPGRNDSLLAVFVLLTFIFYIKYIEEQRIKNLLLSILFLAVSLFTKESGVLVIPIILFYLYFIYKKNNKDNKLSINKFYFFFSSVGVASLWIILRHFALRGSPSINLINMIKSILINSPAILQFAGKIFFPFNLSVLPVIQDTTFVYGIFSIVILTFLLIFTNVKRWNYILFGVGWFFAFLLPSFIRPNSNLVADFIEHRLYVPIIGIFIILLETDIIKSINFKKKAHLIVLIALIIGLSLITLIHSNTFKNRLNFWKDAAMHSPHYPLAHRNLGAMEYLDGDTIDAEKEYKIALKLNPNEPMAHNNLGLIYANNGDIKAAEDEYKNEIQVNPYYDDVYFNLGLLYFGQKRNDEAVENWKKTLDLNPNHLGALKVLTNYYYNNKKYEEALGYANILYRMGFELPPDLLKMIELGTVN
ncbi:MAG: tetratricopeptide repeat protein [Candidatus Nomurabacteria bacterium]